nr:MAG: putative maturation protein [Leviviridae sp.]
MARIRTIFLPPNTGTRIRKFTGIEETRTTGGGESRCTDELGYGTDHPMTIEHYKVNFPRLTGDTGTVASGYVWNNYPVTNLGANVSPFGDSLTPEPSDVYSATKVAADTNPGRPNVSVPLLLFETISSIPETIFQTGLRLSQGKRPGGGNSIAASNFGWEQLYRDVAGLFDFTEHVKDRSEELRRLHQKGGLKRKRRVWTDQQVIHSSATLQSQGVVVSAAVVRHKFREKWVSVRWKPTQHVPLGPTDQVQMARTLVHGWHIAPADVWNALPWSWLADYFGNIGQYLGATRNSNLFTLDSCCVCQRSILKVSYGKVTHSWGDELTVTTPGSSWELKTRKLGTIGLTTDVPIISAQRLINLAGIAANYR